MLVLARHAGEGAVIELEDGRRIRVAVVEVSGGHVRLGFDAPATIAINREEVQGRIDRERGRR